MYHGILKSLPPAQDPNGDESRRPRWRRGSGGARCHRSPCTSRALTRTDRRRPGDSHSAVIERGPGEGPRRLVGLYQFLKEDRPRMPAGVTRKAQNTGISLSGVLR